MDTRLARLVGPVIGLFPVSVLYLDGYWDVRLAAVIWVIYAIAGWLVVRRQDVWRESGNRWSALLVVVAMGGSQFGVHMGLPIPDELTVALWFLVLGVGFAGAAVGVEMAGAKDSDAATERDVVTPTAD